MAIAPPEPSVETQRFPAAPWLGSFWSLLSPFFRATSEALRHGLTLRENLAADLVTTTVRAGASGALSHDPIPLRAGLVPVAVVLGRAEEMAGAVGTPASLSLPAWSVIQVGGSPALRLHAAQGVVDGKVYRLTLALFAG